MISNDNYKIDIIKYTISIKYYDKFCETLLNLSVMNFIFSFLFQMMSESTPVQLHALSVADNLPVFVGKNVQKLVLAELDFLREVNAHPNLYTGPVVNRAIRR